MRDKANMFTGGMTSKAIYKKLWKSRHSGTLEDFFLLGACTITVADMVRRGLTVVTSICGRENTEEDGTDLYIHESTMHSLLQDGEDRQITKRQISMSR